MKKRTRIGLLIAGFVLFNSAIILIVRQTREEREFSDAYANLEMGMTGDEVEESFGVPPDFKCAFQAAIIHYYKPPPPRVRWLDTRGEIDRTRFTEDAVVTDLNDVPDPYDHVVVAYGPDGRLIAYTRVGEELHIHTKARGPVDGASFLRLRPSDLE